nr:hypothetical protein [Tanacetum cinerariifolium]
MSLKVLKSRKEPSLGFNIGSPSASVNTEPPKDVEEPKVQPAKVTVDSGESPKAGVFVVHPGSVVLASKRGSVRKGELGKAIWIIKWIWNYLISITTIMRGRLWWIMQRRAYEFLQVIEKMSGEDDVIKDRERSHKEECYQVTLSTLESKVNSLQADKARLEAVEASLRIEVEDLKQDRRDVVSKVVPYAAIELVHSDELGRLVGKLVSSAITYGCCRAYEQASNDFATVTFPWLDEFVADATAPIETLLSKKPPMLQKHAPSRTQMHVPFSQKATPSSAPSSNPMSPPADLVKPSLSPLK